jgi:hypothetical protein
LALIAEAEHLVTLGPADSFPTEKPKHQSALLAFPTSATLLLNGMEVQVLIHLSEEKGEVGFCCF